MTEPRIEPTSSGYGVIRFTEEQRRAIKAERTRRLNEHERRFRSTYSGSQGTKGLKGHTFTRRTYRAAVDKAFEELPERAWKGQFGKQLRLINAIWDRGRREKGMWCA